MTTTATAATIRTAVRAADRDAKGYLTATELAAVLDVTPRQVRAIFRAEGHAAGRGAVYALPIKDAVKLVRRVVAV